MDTRLECLEEGSHCEERGSRTESIVSIRGGSFLCENEFAASRCGFACPLGKSPIAAPHARWSGVRTSPGTAVIFAYSARTARRSNM